MNEMTFDEWLAYGMDRWWCGPVICHTHEGLPLTRAEDDEFIDGNDPCVHIIRLYEDVDVKQAVEDFHSPSVWANQ